jgi:prophage regulatory protein
MTPLRVLPTNVVLDRICMSKTQLYRLINSGEFPKPIPIGLQRVGFIEDEVNVWIEQRMRMRDEGVGAEMRRARSERAAGGRR